MTPLEMLINCHADKPQKHEVSKDFVEKPSAFLKACRTVDNIKKAAEDGDPEAQVLKKMMDANNPAFILADLRKYAPRT